jgi:hypothetical protein
MLDALRHSPPEMHRDHLKDSATGIKLQSDTWGDSMQAYAYLLYSGLSADARNEIRAVYRGH